jgi:hypothetical protein
MVRPRFVRDRQPGDRLKFWGTDDPIGAARRAKM